VADVNPISDSMGTSILLASNNQQAAVALSLLDAAAQVGQAVSSGAPAPVRVHVSMPAPDSTFQTYA
jgi:hypothetical protein